MNINEIRVGNLVYFAILNIVEVTAINPQKLISTSKNSISGKDEIYDMVSFKGNTASGNDRIEAFDPIPLTEEILLKCGFTKSRNIGCYDTDKDAFFFESDKISLTIDFILSSSNHYYRSNPVDGAIPLKYLHQLQNLVFSVTGKELEINL